jgi:hypothetical protein
MAREQVDWGRIKLMYRAGILSLRELGLMFGVSHVAIWKRAKTGGWPHDLRPAVYARARELVAIASREQSEHLEK